MKCYEGGQIKENGMGEVCDEHNRGGKCTESFGQIPERNGELIRPMCRWKDNIKMYFK